MPLIDPTLLLRVNNTKHAIRTPFDMQRLRESEYRFFDVAGPPSPVPLLALDQFHVEGRRGSKIHDFEVVQFSLICWARRGVNRLHVAMSPPSIVFPARPCFVELNPGAKHKAFRHHSLWVIGALLDSEVWNRPSDR